MSKKDSGQIRRLEEVDLNQGISDGTYSRLKIFHQRHKVQALLDGKVTAPVYARIKPTNKCLDGCFYCIYDPQFSGIHQTTCRTDEIPREKMDEILSDFKRMRVKAVTYSGGGEPLGYPGIVDVLGRTLTNGIDLSVITNGHLITGEVAEALSRASWVRVSADYCNAKMFEKIRKRPQNWFAQRVERIRKFAAMKDPSCDLEVNCVVHEHNFDKLADIAKFWRDVGVGNIRFAPLWRMNDFEAYHAPLREAAIAQIETSKKLVTPEFKVGSTYQEYFGLQGTGTYSGRCFWMEVVPVIAADQGVYTCHNKAYDPSGKIGSVKDQSFRKMWYSPETAKFFREFKPGERCKHECSSLPKNMLFTDFASSENHKGRNFV